MRPFTRRCAGANVTVGLRAVRLAVMVLLVVDVVATLIGHAYSSTGWGPSGLLPDAQRVLVVAAAGATMWYRYRSAVLLTALVVALVLVTGPSGGELWLVVVIGVTAVARANPRQVALVILGQFSYGVVFAAIVESRRPGQGWAVGLTTLGVSVAAFAIGLVVRRLLQLRENEWRRVMELENENRRIRTIERKRLARDLQAVLNGGLTAIEEQIHNVARNRTDPTCLGTGLAKIDAESRSLLTELRALLDVLRPESAPTPEAGRSRRPPPDG